jgi:hypothetical protein
MMKCPDCGGDGIETCNNPDHGFIDALSFHDVGRIGCPVCGHDPKHKVPNGGPCPTCHGKGDIHPADNEVDVDFEEEYEQLMR